jgi:hypothetical protein
MPPLFLLVGRVDWLYALQLGALDDTVSLLVELEAKSLLLLSLALLRSQSSNDGVEINSVKV